MIAKMNKFAFLILKQEYEDFLKVLRSKGVVHIQEKELKKNIDILRSISDKILFATNIKKELSSLVSSSDLNSDILLNEKINDIDLFCHETKNIIEELSKIKLKISNETKIYEDVYPWGDFDIDVISSIESSTTFKIDFVVLSKKVFDRYKYLSNIIFINDYKGKVYALFIRDSKESLSIEDLKIISKPERNYIQIKTNIEHLQYKENEILSNLRNRYLVLDKYINNYLEDLENRYNFNKAILTGEEILDGNIVYIEGWIPEEYSDKVKKELERSSYFIKQLEIDEMDKIPILLKNNFFGKLFEPITEMFSLPNYQEIDQTSLFAPFFMLFFGMCFGDGGYGLLLFIIVTILRIKKSSIDTNILSLLQWLGGGAFIVGMLMGSFFGIVLPYAKPEDYFLNQNSLMALSLIVGVIQILFGKTIAAYKIHKQRGIKYSIASFSWVIFLITSIVYFTLPIFNSEIPSFINYIIYGIGGICLLIVFLFNTPDKNPLMNIGIGVWNTYNMASGLLGDTLSYVRLFAIGLTGGILGGVFNQLAIAQTAGLNLFVRIPLALFILLVGHSINICLAMIGSFVHPLRLTFVEFYKNSEFEGGGIKYRPFVKNKTN